MSTRSGKRTNFGATNAGVFSAHLSPLFPMCIVFMLLISLSNLTEAQTTENVHESVSLSSIATPDLSSMLSLKNLGEYNQLIDCVAKIKDSFTHCNEEAQRKGEAVLKYVNEKSELGTLLKCCGIWLVRDCWVNAAKGKCTDEQAHQLQNMPSKMMPGLERICEKHPAGSNSCYTPHIIFGAIMLSVLLLVIILLVVIIFVGRHIYRRRQGSTKLESGVVDDEHDQDSRAEKVKLTSNTNGENNNSMNNNLEYIDSEKGN